MRFKFLNYNSACVNQCDKVFDMHSQTCLFFKFESIVKQCNN